MKRVFARTTVLLLAVGVSGGCASATISANASTASAYVVHKKMFNQYMMRCTAETPNQPVCTVLQEQE